METISVLFPKNCFKKRKRKWPEEANISKSHTVFRFWVWLDVTNVGRRSPPSNTPSFTKLLTAKQLIFIIAAPKNLVFVLKHPLPVLRWKDN
ncbi:hypothetical protein CO166_04455 [Candidatus Roizmanbacteria bacterium CG_4_9_14_3_um_filter_36_11]|nr:MAG: hypothetical protein CO166_04455 [Candidatus Roizmanbacteria bacterium CG_4_9_14_3_um_filter_36_11]